MVRATIPAPSSNGTPSSSSPFSSYFSGSPSKITILPRLAISLEAQDKCGKTHWGLATAPDPIAISYTDPGTAMVIQKIRALYPKKQIFGQDLTYTRISHRDGHRESDESLVKEWLTKWDLFQHAQLAIAANPKIKTVIRDTESEIWQLCQLAHFQKLDKIPQHLRTSANAAYLATFRCLYSRPDLNIILIHQTKKQYAPNSKGEDAWTGKYERDGMNKIGFQVDLILRAGWDPQFRKFFTYVPEDQATRFGAELAGKRWMGEESGFGWLGMECYPDTVETPEVWGL
jgi:hypothetical protein